MYVQGLNSLVRISTTKTTPNHTVLEVRSCQLPYGQSHAVQTAPGLSAMQGLIDITNWPISSQ